MLDDPYAMIPMPRVWDMVRAAVEAEREACAQLAEPYEACDNRGDQVEIGRDIAAAIRARGT